MSRSRKLGNTLHLVAALAVAAFGSSAHATLCGTSDYPFPFTDVGNVIDVFCRGIHEAYVLGVTLGTTATTFGPDQDVTRSQMTTFLQRSVDQGLKRSNRRGALGQWWTPKTAQGLRRTALPGVGLASFCKADGERVWVTNGTNLLSVLASTGELQANIDFGAGVDVKGLVIANGGALYVAPTSQRLAFAMPKRDAPFHGDWGYQIVSYTPNAIAFDGDRVWTANYTASSITIRALVAGEPTGSSTEVTLGFGTPLDIIFDGSNMWIADPGFDQIIKLDANGAILQRVGVGADPAYMAYDGANIWVPNLAGNSVSVVRAATGAIVATLVTDASNALSVPVQAAFDGERILVTNLGNDSVTLFRAADLSVIRNVPLPAGSDPYGVCSDGINFFVTLRGTKQLLRL
jgi:YVTN family beta-propeller protein